MQLRVNFQEEKDMTDTRMINADAKQYIEAHWEECIRSNHKDCGTLIGVPYPYIVPAVGHFDELFYWDTYFTNKGLELSDRWQQAKYNVDNMLYLTDRYGYMPNGNRTYYLNRSQPPFLSLMVKDIYEHFQDPVWLKSAYEVLEKEYAFWMSKRICPLGLNIYGGKRAEELSEEARELTERIGEVPGVGEHALGEHFLACAESGWDFNGRWNIEAVNFIPVDLNALLYQMEKTMEYFSAELGIPSKIWRERAEKRKCLMEQYLRTEKGIYTDYNYVTGRYSDLFSAASYYPLFAGLVSSDDAQVAVDELRRLEAAYGIAAAEKKEGAGSSRSYQWGYPNGWPCVQYIVYMGLDRYGFRNEAKRIAGKYIAVVDINYRETGKLWEKYNVVEGNICVKDEYKMPPMMGWSAGVYLAAQDYLRSCDEEIMC